jgi:hypothetical protein
VRERSKLPKSVVRVFVYGIVVVCAGANIYFARQAALPLMATEALRPVWLTEQTYAKPFAWLDKTEQEPVVVWSNPASETSSLLPVFTKHFTLYTPAAMGQLVSSDEIRERFLVSEYFNKPTLADLESTDLMTLFLGRRDSYHHAATIAREVKVCRILFYWDKSKDCGTIPTPRELLGDAFFADMEKRFVSDIRPHIKEYVAKYHVSYILKDIALDPEYHPEKLGASLVYKDEHFEIYKLP